MSTNSYSIDQEKWSKLDIFNQMGNIYSEVGRSFKTLSSDDIAAHTAAITRAIDLFDATVQSQIAVKSPKAKEVMRAKEEFLSAISNKSTDKTTIESLDRYFMQFAIAARLKH